MAGEIIKIDGIEDVQQMLNEAPRVIVAKGYARALQAGIEVVRKELEIRTPVSGQSEWQRVLSNITGKPPQGAGGQLKAALVTEVTLDSQFRGGYAEAGYGQQDHVAQWVEYGHRMVGHKPQKKNLGEVPPHPFMRPAADAAADGAIEAVADSLIMTMKQEYEGN